MLWIWRLLCFIRFATNWKICIIFKYLLFNRRVSSRFAIHWKNCSVFKICSALCCVLEDFLHLGIFAVYRKICCELEDLLWIGRFGVHWKIWCALKDLLCIERFGRSFNRYFFLLHYILRSHAASPAVRELYKIGK